jgi:hypothetical protein
MSISSAGWDSDKRGDKDIDRDYCHHSHGGQRSTGHQQHGEVANHFPVMVPCPADQNNTDVIPGTFLLQIKKS